VKECRDAGIECPIIPGIMPIIGYERFHNTLKFTKSKVPKFLLDGLEPLKQDDEKVRKFGAEFVT
jgi:methylenetetrahydrofolate reductase (NADPH)